MKLTYHIITLSIMFSAAISHAQIKKSPFTWRIAGAIPPAKGEITAPGVAGPVTGIYNDIMIIAGGANFPDSMPWQGGKKRYYQQGYFFAAKGKHFVPVNEVFELPEPIAYAATCSTPSGIFYAGGENEKGIASRSYLLKWDKRIQKLVTDELPGLPIGLVNAACANLGNTVFIAGGETKEGVSASCWSLDLEKSKDGWKALPVLPVPVSHAVLAVVQKDDWPQLFLFGGRRKNQSGISELYSAVYTLNLLQKEWVAKPSLPYSLSAGTGLAAGENEIYLFGGDQGTVFSQVENCLAAINAETDVVKKQILVQKKNQLLLTHPGFSKTVLHYNLSTGIFTPAGFIPFSSPVTTTAFWFKKSVMIPSGEIRAGVRSPQILMAKYRSKHP